MNHMILGSCMLVCAIRLIFIPTYERNNFKQLIPTRFRQVNLHPDRNLAHIEAFPTLLLSLMVSDWFLEILSKQKSDIAIPVFCSFHISLVFITTIIKDSGLGRETSVIFECYQFNCFILLFLHFRVYLYWLLPSSLLVTKHVLVYGKHVTWPAGSRPYLSIQNATRLPDLCPARPLQSRTPCTRVLAQVWYTS